MTSGIGGRSIDPLLILTIIALALALITLLSKLFTLSISPSSPLFTRYATCWSLSRLSIPPAAEGAELTLLISGIGGRSTDPLLILTIIALTLPRITLLWFEFTLSISPSSPLLTR